MSFIMIKILWLNAKKRNVQIQTRIHPKRWILLYITLNSIVFIVYICTVFTFYKGNTKHWTVLPPSQSQVWQEKLRGSKLNISHIEHKGLAGFFVKYCVYSCRRLTPISIEDDASTDPIPWFDWLSISELKRREAPQVLQLNLGLAGDLKGQCVAREKGEMTRPPRRLPL